MGLVGKVIAGCLLVSVRLVLVVLTLLQRVTQWGMNRKHRGFRCAFYIDPLKTVQALNFYKALYTGNGGVYQVVIVVVAVKQKLVLPLQRKGHPTQA